jgi:hypothetical protein
MNIRLQGYNEWKDLFHEMEWEFSVKDFCLNKTKEGVGLVGVEGFGMYWWKDCEKRKGFFAVFLADCEVWTIWQN